LQLNIRRAILLVLAFPLLQAYRLTRYAQTRRSWPEKIVTFVSYSGDFALGTMVWVIGWLAAISLARNALE